MYFQIGASFLSFIALVVQETHRPTDRSKDRLPLVSAAKLDKLDDEKQAAAGPV